MKRIYLDQRIWVDLAKAEKQVPEAKKYANALAVARYGSQHGLVSLPLSPTHYMELKHGTSARQRREIGGLMYELSRGDRIRNPDTHVLAAEIDAALKKRFRLPNEPRTVRIFGKGVAHAFNFAPVQGRIVSKDGGEPKGIDPMEKSKIEALANEMFEQWTLMGPPEDVDVSNSGYDPQAHREFEDRFLKTEEDQAARLRDPRVSGKQTNLMHAQAIVDIRKPLVDACLRAGINPLGVTAPGKEFLKGFLQDLPVEFATFELRRLQHENPGRAWRKSDTYDLRALPMAIVHCDIVVAEKHWSHMIRRAGLDKRYGTVVLTDVAELPKHVLK